MKFYRYVLYRFYTWRIKKKDAVPIATTVFVLSSVHYFQLLIVLMLLGEFFPVIYNMFSLTIPAVLLIGFALCIIYYFIIRRMRLFTDSSNNEFENETERERRKGSFKVLLYLVGSVVAFFISLPLIFGLGK